ncbi:hypothetical protein PG997_007939 [Apiospora hydei]|uniref:BTB domain-containing protein n=1 Tax=Apiospora hydei TaxID=1337664 RepID=A0ABR1WC75_9PEZI
MDPDIGDQGDVYKDISLDGDVVLVVGEEKKVRLKVNSQNLSCASKVFRTMFGPNWSEGQGLSKESPKEVELVEDDADAMYAICCVIHHRNDLAPKAISPQQVLQIAIAADKYDLSVALAYARAQWLRSRDIADPTTLAYLMAAARWFDDEPAFIKCGRALVLRCVGSYARLMDDEVLSQMLPSNIPHILEERRTRVRAELGELISNEAKEGCACGWGARRSKAFQQLARDHSPLKMLWTPVSQVMRNIQTPMVKLVDGPKYCPNRHFTHPPTPYARASQALEDARRKAIICYECVNASSKGTSCTSKHG